MRKKRLTTVHVARGGNVKVPATPTAPVITKIDGSHFSIFWPGINPFDWAIQVQGEEGGEWDFDRAITGSARTSDGVGNPYAVRIVGRNEGHDPVTDVSGILILNPPPATSNIVASYDESHDELTWTFDGTAPDLWHIEYSLDGGATWTTSEDLPGTSLNEAPSFEPSKVRIYAKSNTLGVTGEPSNVVSVSGG